MTTVRLPKLATFPLFDSSKVAISFLIDCARFLMFSGSFTFQLSNSAKMIMIQQHRLKEYEGSGIELNYSNKLGQPSTICGVLTFVSKDSIILMDCYKKEHIVKREGIKNFKPIRYGKTIKK